jgi:hypothetical protein
MRLRRAILCAPAHIALGPKEKAAEAAHVGSQTGSRAAEARCRCLNTQDWPPVLWRGRNRKARALGRAPVRGV